MKCFLGCFFASKHQKQHESMNTSTSESQKNDIESVKLEEIEEPIKPITESIEMNDEQVKCQTQKKKVTFDLNVKTHEEFAVVNDVLDKTANPDDGYDANVGGVEKQLVIEQELSDSLFSISIDSRKQGNDGGDYEQRLLIQQESSDSLFSLAIDPRKQVNGIEKDDEKEVNSPMPKPISPDEENRIQIHSHSVLKPLENLTQLKSVKGRTIPPPHHHQAKENIPTNRSNPNGLIQTPRYNNI